MTGDGMTMGREVRSEVQTARAKELDSPGLGHRGPPWKDLSILPGDSLWALARLAFLLPPALPSGSLGPQQGPSGPMMEPTLQEP